MCDLLFHCVSVDLFTVTIASKKTKILEQHKLKVGTESKLHSVKSLPILLVESELTLYKWTKRVKAKIKRIRTLLIEQKTFFKDLQEVKFLKPKL